MKIIGGSHATRPDRRPMGVHRAVASPLAPTGGWPGPALAEDLEKRGEIDLGECFVDGSFSAAKKGAPQ